MRSCKRVYWFGLLFWVMTGNVVAQMQRDTSLVTTDFEDIYTIKNDTLTYSYINGSILKDVVMFRSDLSKSLTANNCTYSFPLKLQMSKCFFKENQNSTVIKTCNGARPYLNFINGFTIVNSKFASVFDISNVICTNELGAALIVGDSAQNINISNSQFNYLEVESNNLENSIKVERTTAVSFLCDQNEFRSPQLSYLWFKNSKFTSDFTLISNQTPSIIIENCQLSGEINLVFDRSTTDAEEKDHTIILIKNTFIDGRCYINTPTLHLPSKLVFENCNFGHAASIFNLNVDTIIFKNCSDIPHPLFLTADTSKKEIYIELINSNVNNIRFDYTDKWHLFFESLISPETKSNTYQSLLAKYKAEGKPENIEKIDVEYKRYHYQQSWLFYPLWLLDYVWWHYGYSKWLVIVWTLIFLALFFTYNYRHWDGMRQIYGVFDKEELSVLSLPDGGKRKWRKAAFVLLFTSFIFFSLRIDFDKLKYASTRYLTAFFTQYVTGLICLFFLANAIFKLG